MAAAYLCIVVKRNSANSKAHLKCALLAIKGESFSWLLAALLFAVPTMSVAYEGKLGPDVKVSVFKGYGSGVYLGHGISRSTSSGRRCSRSRRSSFFGRIGGGCPTVPFLVAGGTSRRFDFAMTNRLPTIDTFP
jgi:hypothetical protein